jgi:para-nitrobenzyl esterase
MQQQAIVDTAAGKLRGFEHRGARRFLGIPYGEPPVGELRLATARPATPWAGILEAKSFGASAMQSDIRETATGSWTEVLSWMYPRTGNPLEGDPMSEDCLFLNVWAPAEKQAGGLPVMGWFHGGGFVQGSGGEMLYNGDNLAVSGNVIVVTVNHRLGVFGYLPLDMTLGEGFAHAGVAGLTDLVVALEWVRDTIAAFGGDPGNVTIFGQSGGGVKVCLLMGMPSAQGLFHRAIVQSRAGSRVRGKEEGLELVGQFLEALSINRESAARRLREMPAERLLAAQMQLASLKSGPGPFQAPWSKGSGSAMHDASLLLCAEPEHAALSARQLREWLSAIKADAGEPREDEPPRLQLARVISELTFRHAVVEPAEAKSVQTAPVYAYLFAYPTPILGGLLGATHSLDILFVFNNAVRSPFCGGPRGSEAGR